MKIGDPCRMALLFGVAGVLMFADTDRAAADDASAVVCVDPVYPTDRETTIRLGYSRDVVGWKPGELERAKDRAWVLKLADDFIIHAESDPDRPEVRTKVMISLVYPEMFPTVELQQEAQALGIADFRASTRLPGCRRRAPMDLATLKSWMSDHDVSVTLSAPFLMAGPYDPEAQCKDEPRLLAQRRPELDFDGLLACHLHGRFGEWDYVSYYGTLDGAFFALTCPTNALRCTAAVDLDTWPVYIGFAQSRRPEWRNILQAAKTFLASVTLVKSEIVRDP